MIEMYLNNWPTLIYFLHEKQTLHNFIISLKRKESEELKLLNEILFKKIMKRCINLNTQKIRNEYLEEVTLQQRSLCLQSLIISTDMLFVDQLGTRDLVNNDVMQLLQSRKSSVSFILCWSHFFTYRSDTR